MNQEAEVHKSESRSSRIPSSLLDTIFLEKLFETLYTANEEARELALKDIKPKNSRSAQEYQQFQELVSSSFKLMVSISGANGEFFTSDDKTIFKDVNLPDKVNTVLFSNATYFKSKFNFEPAYKIEVILDFSTPSLINFKPSEETLNISSAVITGLNQTWVRGTYESIISALKERRKRTAWLHKKGVYDLLLWFGVIPLAFYYMQKFNNQVAAFTKNMTTVLTVGFYIYLCLFILMAFMMFFNYTRWLYPYLELKNNINNRAILHRLVFFTLFLSVLGSMIYDVFKYVKSVL